jgi:hypothetical protein
VLLRADVHDLAGNYLELDAELGDATYEGTSIPVARTSVVGAQTDVTPPVVFTIGFEASSYAAGSTGYVVYTAADDISGITDFEGTCWTIENAEGTTTLAACGDVESLGDDTYRVPFDVDAFSDTGTFSLLRADVHDAAGNYLELDALFGDAVYEGTAISVPSVTITP